MGGQAHGYAAGHITDQGRMLQDQRFPGLGIKASLSDLLTVFHVSVHKKAYFTRPPDYRRP
jgi:hypothetical protein